MVSQKNTFNRETSSATDHGHEETGWLRRLLVEERPMVAFPNKEISIRESVWGAAICNSDSCQDQLYKKCFRSRPVYAIQ